MFSSIAAAPASCIACAYSTQPPGVMPLMLPITGTSTAAAARSSRLRYGRAPASSSAAAGKYDSDSAKLSAPASTSRAFSAASRRSCSSKSE